MHNDPYKVMSVEVAQLAQSEVRAHEQVSMEADDITTSCGTAAGSASAPSLEARDDDEPMEPSCKNAKTYRTITEALNAKTKQSQEKTHGRERC